MSLKLERGIVIRWVCVITTIIAFLGGIVLPIPLDQWTIDMYEEIEALPAGSVALMFVHAQFATWPSVLDAFRAVVKHLHARDIGIVLVGCVWVDAAQEINDLIRDTGLGETGVYGVDYANYGFIAGGMSTIAAMVDNVPAILGVDVFGTRISDLPIMQGILQGDDFDMCVVGWSGGDTIPALIGPASRYKIPLLWCATGTMIPQWNRGDINGFTEGAVGGSQYEYLSGFPGLGLRTDTAVALITTFDMIILGIANVYWFIYERKKKPEIGISGIGR